jgi:hypothetical protein
LNPGSTGFRIMNPPGLSKIIGDRSAVASQ